MSNWQPIETAPKDGTDILLARYLPGVGWAIGAGGWIRGEIGRWWQWGMDENDPEPTHWMPLLEPPK